MEKLPSVNEFHHHSDVDSSVFAQHHTLGPRAGQAAAGNHKHADLIARLDALEVEKPLRRLEGPAQAIGNATWTHKSMVNAAANPTRGDIGFANSSIVINVEGFYVVTAANGWVTHTSGRNILGIGRNNGGVLAPGVGHFTGEEEDAGATNLRQSLTVIDYFLVGDFIWLDVWQNSGGTINTAVWTYLQAAMI